MTHPHVLHATAAAWSLAAALQVLRQRATIEAADIRAYAYAADVSRDGLQGWRPGSGRPAGGHADPVGNGYGHDEPVTRVPVLANLLAETEGALRDIARHIGTGDGTPLDQILAGLSDPTGIFHTPAAASFSAIEFARLDTTIRAKVRVKLARLHMPLNPPCPACAARLLRIQTAAPDTAHWTVVCIDSACLCTGDGCLCGMDIPTPDVRHIWGSASVLVTSTLARLIPRQIADSLVMEHEPCTP